MPAFTNPKIKDYFTRLQGGIAMNAYPIPLETELTLSGTRAAGDVDELFVLRRGHRIVKAIISASGGLASADANVEFGIINGNLGASPSTDASDTADEQRTVRAGKLSLNSDDISAAVYKVHENAQMYFDIDENAERAVGFKWTAARATGDETVKAVIFIAVPGNTGVA